MEVSVLGPGCRNCVLLKNRVGEALVLLGVDARVGTMTDPDEIVALGVMATPGLLVNGSVVVSGKVPTTQALVELLQASGR